MHKKKRLIQSPNSYFMDVKCQGCFNIVTVFSHAQTVVTCPGCNQVYWRGSHVEHMQAIRAIASYPASTFKR